MCEQTAGGGLVFCSRRRTTACALIRRDVACSSSKRTRGPATPGSRKRLPPPADVLPDLGPGVAVRPPDEPVRALPPCGTTRACTPLVRRRAVHRHH